MLNKTGIYFKKRMHSFQYAINGLKEFISSEHHARIHILLMLAAIAFGLLLKINNTEWLMLIVVISMVFISEMINTSIEKICNYIQPEIHPDIKIIKDISAGAVMIASLGALIIGCIIFLPNIINR